MFESILNINSDSIPIGIRRDVAKEEIAPFEIYPSHFEYIPTHESGFHFDVNSFMPEMTSSHWMERMAGIPVNMPFQVENTLFIIFACCFILLALASRSAGGLFILNLKSIVSLSGQKRSGFKDQISISRLWINLILVLQTVVLLSVIVATFNIFHNSDGMFFSSGELLPVLLYSFVGVLFFVIIKFVIYRFVDYIFPDWGLSGWVSQYFIVVGLIGLFIFLPSMFFVFATKYYTVSLSLLVLGLSLGLFFFYRNLLIVFVKNKIGLLNYLLYLCAIEIVPFLLLYKGGIILSTIAGI